MADYVDVCRFNVKVFVNSNDGESYSFDSKIEFGCNPEDYGNGYHMYVQSSEEPFHGQGYDIRYNKDFHKDEKLLFIVQFYSDRYSGKNGWWKLVGIRVHEAE